MISKSLRLGSTPPSLEQVLTSVQTAYENRERPRRLTTIVHRQSYEAGRLDGYADALHWVLHLLGARA